MRNSSGIRTHASLSLDINSSWNIRYSSLGPQVDHLYTGVATELSRKIMENEPEMPSLRRDSRLSGVYPACCGVRSFSGHSTGVVPLCGV